MRQRWINLLLDTYTDLGLPADYELRRDVDEAPRPCEMMVRPCRLLS
ncbi:MAG: hypothetical protein JWM58_320 [Rhizobium sp.]|nr:hypothetical protein [Rhizobium sp.]